MTTEIAAPATLPILSHWIAGHPVEVLRLRPKARRPTRFAPALE
jgi:hypothetical protein